MKMHGGKLEGSEQPNHWKIYVGVQLYGTDKYLCIYIYMYIYIYTYVRILAGPFHKYASDSFYKKAPSESFYKPKCL